MRSFIHTMILGLFLVSTVGLHAEDTSVLKEVTATVVGGHSKIAFRFDGDARFSTEQVKNGVRLIFSRTRAAAVQVLGRRVFPAGPVESIGFQRPATDSIIAVVAFVSGSTYRCMCPAGGNELIVDVKGSAAVRQMAAQKPASSPVQKSAPAATAVRTAGTPAGIPAVATEEPVRPASGSSLIDIPAMARKQMEQEGGECAPAGQRAGTVFTLSLPVVAISIIVSLAATGVVLLVLSRATRRQAASVAIPEVHAAVSASPAPVHIPLMSEEEDDDDMKPEPERVRALFRVPVREEEQEEQEEDAGRETSLQLARTFRRGSEEITLTRKFHERPSPALTPAKMQTAMARATTKTQRLTAARKLGVGRGEFDLAEKLKTLAQSPAKKEEVQP